MRRLSPGVQEKMAACFSALGLRQMTTSRRRLERTAVSSLSSGGQTSLVKVWRQGRAPPEAPVEEPSCLFPFLWAQALLGSWLHHSHLCLRL